MPDYGKALKTLCTRYRAAALDPLDNELAEPDAVRQANERMIRDATAVLADYTPFRNPCCGPFTP